MQERDTRKSILQMARGAIMERVDYEMTSVIDNILDPNTKATAKRKLTVTIELTPDDNRQTIAVQSSVKSTLCPTNPVATALYLTNPEKGDATAVEMVPNIPGQANIFGDDEEESAPILKLVNCQ